MAVYFRQWEFIIALNLRKYRYHNFLFSRRYLGYDAKKIIWIIVSFLIALFRAIDIWTSMNLWPSTLAATNTSCTTCSNKTIFQKWNCSWRSSTRFSIYAYSIVNFWYILHAHIYYDLWENLSKYIILLAVSKFVVTWFLGTRLIYFWYIVLHIFITVV